MPVSTILQNILSHFSAITHIPGRPSRDAYEINKEDETIVIKERTGSSYLALHKIKGSPPSIRITAPNGFLKPEEAFSLPFHTDIDLEIPHGCTKDGEPTQWIILKGPILMRWLEHWSKLQRHPLTADDSSIETNNIKKQLLMELFFTEEEVNECIEASKRHNAAHHQLQAALSTIPSISPHNLPKKPLSALSILSIKIQSDLQEKNPRSYPITFQISDAPEHQKSIKDIQDWFRSIGCEFVESDLIHRATIINKEANPIIICGKGPGDWRVAPCLPSDPKATMVYFHIPAALMPTIMKQLPNLHWEDLYNITKKPDGADISGEPAPATPAEPLAPNEPPISTTKKQEQHMYKYSWLNNVIAYYQNDNSSKGFYEYFSFGFGSWALFDSTPKIGLFDIMSFGALTVIHKLNFSALYKLMETNSFFALIPGIPLALLWASQMIVRGAFALAATPIIALADNLIRKPLHFLFGKKYAAQKEKIESLKFEGLEDRNRETEIRATFSRTLKLPEDLNHIRISIVHNKNLNKLQLLLTNKWSGPSSAMGCEGCINGGCSEGDTPHIDLDDVTDPTLLDGIATLIKFNIGDVQGKHPELSRRIFEYATINKHIPKYDSPLEDSPKEKLPAHSITHESWWQPGHASNTGYTPGYNRSGYYQKKRLERCSMHTQDEHNIPTCDFNHVAFPTKPAPSLF